MSDENIISQASQVNDLLAAEGIPQFIEKDPFTPFKRQGESDEDALKSFAETAKNLDSRNRSSEARYEPSDEGGEVDPPAALPSRFQSPEDVQQGAQWLAAEVQKVEHLYQTNQITKGQYDRALAEANSLANELHGAHLGLREQQLAARDQVEAIHKEISNLIPEWSDPASRARIQGQMQNFLGEYGVPAHLVNQISDPNAIGAIHALMKDVHSLKSQRSRQLQQIKARQAESRKANGRETSSYRNLTEQTAAVGDILRQAGVF